MKHAPKRRPPVLREASILFAFARNTMIREGNAPDRYRGPTRRALERILASAVDLVERRAKSLHLTIPQSRWSGQISYQTMVYQNVCSSAGDFLACLPWIIDLDGPLLCTGSGVCSDRFLFRYDEEHGLRVVGTLGFVDAAKTFSRLVGPDTHGRYILPSIAACNAALAAAVRNRPSPNPDGTDGFGPVSPPAPENFRSFASPWLAGKTMCYGLQHAVDNIFNSHHDHFRNPRFDNATERLREIEQSACKAYARAKRFEPLFAQHQARLLRKFFHIAPQSTDQTIAHEALRIARRAGNTTFDAVALLLDPVAGRNRRQFFERYPFLLREKLPAHDRWFGELLAKVDRGSRDRDCLKSLRDARNGQSNHATYLARHWTSAKAGRIRSAVRRYLHASKQSVVNTLATACLPEAAAIVRGIENQPIAEIVRALVAVHQAHAIWANVNASKTSKLPPTETLQRWVRALLALNCSTEQLATLATEWNDIANAVIGSLDHRASRNAQRARIYEAIAPQQARAPLATRKLLDTVRQWPVANEAMRYAANNASRQANPQAAVAPLEWRSPHFRHLPKAIRSLRPLESSDALAIEGDTLGHCVSQYTSACIGTNNRSKVSHIYALEGAHDERLTVEFIECDNGTNGVTYSVNQCYGRNYATASGAIARALQTLVGRLIANRGVDYDQANAPAIRKEASAKHYAVQRARREHRDEVAEAITRARREVLAVHFPDLVELVRTTPVPSPDNPDNAPSPSIDWASLLATATAECLDREIPF